jgi:pyridoxal 5'-phosphate synthase pdxT subunit
MVSPACGVLALQGDFDAHQSKLNELGAESVLVKKRAELDSISGLIIPGGESTAFLKLLDDDFSAALVDFAKSGRPIFATCAGLILLATEVTNPQQRSLGVIDAEVKRNAYGRQIDSFITKECKLTEEGAGLAEQVGAAGAATEAVFIRAPEIERVGKDVSVLMTYKDRPVLVRSKNVLAATFHPELSPSTSFIHQLFLKLARRAAAT